MISSPSSKNLRCSPDGSSIGSLPRQVNSRRQPRSSFSRPETVPVHGRLHDPLLLSDRVDQPDLMGTDQRCQLGPDGPEMSCLDFQQNVVSNDVDDEAVDRDFESIAGLRVPLLERCVQRFLVQQSDAGHRALG